MHRAWEIGLLLLWTWAVSSSYVLLATSPAAPYSWRLAVQALAWLSVASLLGLSYHIEQQQR